MITVVLGASPARSCLTASNHRQAETKVNRNHPVVCRYHRRVTMNEARRIHAAEPAVDEAGALSAAACMFRSLGDPARLAIVRHLTLGEHKVVELTHHLGLAQSTVSAHLACLRDCGLVTSRPQGRASLWSLTAPAELLDVLAAAERLLAATGDAVMLCPTYGERANR
jgi:DNA-binding transcriptional ArsR family regulator